MESLGQPERRPLELDSVPRGTANIGLRAGKAIQQMQFIRLLTGLRGHAGHQPCPMRVDLHGMDRSGSLLEMVQRQFQQIQIQTALERGRHGPRHSSTQDEQWYGMDLRFMR